MRSFYDIVHYNGNVVETISRHNTLIQADDAWKRMEQNATTEDKIDFFEDCRIFLRYYSEENSIAAFFEKTIAGYGCE